MQNIQTATITDKVIKNKVVFNFLIISKMYNYANYKTFIIVVNYCKIVFRGS